MLGRRAAVNWDDLGRLQHRLDECLSELRDLQASHNAMSVEWADIRDQVVRSYKRVEQAQRREDDKAKGVTTPQLELDGEERTDPFSLKLAQIRRQTGAV